MSSSSHNHDTSGGRPAPYRVELRDDVRAIVEGFTPPTRYLWNLCEQVIAEDPHARDGSRAYRLPPIPTDRTFVYQITEELSEATGIPFYLFVADCLPDHRLVYLIDEARHEVTIVFLRDNPWV